MRCRSTGPRPRARGGGQALELKDGQTDIQATFIKSKL